MHIIEYNISETTKKSLDQDILTIQDILLKRGVKYPEINLRINSLSNENNLKGLPEHNVKKPESKIPLSFTERCAWEISKQSFQLIEDGEDIWVIAGGPEGAIYGTMEVLECLFGVIWSGLKEGDILTGPFRSIPVGVQKPSMAYRGMESTPSYEYQIADFLVWMSRNRINAWHRNSACWDKMDSTLKKKVLNICESRSIHLVIGEHVMDFFISENTFEEHPEWMGMRDGQRVKKAFVVILEASHLNSELPIQPCFSNKDFLDFYSEKIAAYIDKTPEIEIFSLWPHDGVNNWCQCKKCVNKTPFEQIYELAENLEKKLPPEIPIEILVYSNMLNIPKNPITKSDRIYTLFCPYLRPYIYRIYEKYEGELIIGTRYPQNDIINPVDEREYGVLFEKWFNFFDHNGSKIGIFEYGNPFSDETKRTNRSRYHYHPDIELRADELVYYAKHGVSVFYMCALINFFPDSYHWWATSKLLWNNYASSGLLEKQYYSAVSKTKGVALRKSLKDISNILLAEKTPKREISACYELLKEFPSSPAIKRYKIWLKYIESGRKAREMELTEDFENAIKQEQKIQAFLEYESPLIKDYLSIDYTLEMLKNFEGYYKSKLKKTNKQKSFNFY